MLRATPVPSTHSPPMKFFMTTVIGSLPNRFLAHEAGAFIVESPTRNQELHGKRIVARPQPVFSVERMRGIDRLAIDLDAEPRTVRNRDFAIPDLQWLPR